MPAPLPEPTTPLRLPEEVLTLARMGSFHQTRLSFMRVLLRRIAAEGWQVTRPLWAIDARGVGTAVYEVRTGEGRIYSLVAFGHDLPAEKRTDRVIAEAWDATFALHDGTVSDADIERLRGNVPRQEAGRCSAAELVMARANRSVRLFDEVVAALAVGRQPETAAVDAVGYLMRTTAVYGGGKFGLADRERYADRPELAGPFAAEMLAVWLIRSFTADLAEHIAALRSPETAVPLDRALRRRLGVGNSTGLGMAPFVVNHPGLFHRWIEARETALARVRGLERAAPEAMGEFFRHLAKGRARIAAWRTDDPTQARRIASLRDDLARLAAHLESQDLAGPFAWDRLFRFAAETLGDEAQEFLVGLLLEPHGALVDDLAPLMAGDEMSDQGLDGAMPLGALREAIERFYGFALSMDFAAPEAQARFWYVSEEKLEPRLGERRAEHGAEREQPLGVGRDVAQLHSALAKHPARTPVAALLAAEPEFRFAVRRVQLAARRPYAEIRDNLLGATMRPVDILRCKLSFFGATDFDPRSDRWVRIALFRDAPFPDEIAVGTPALRPVAEAPPAVPEGFSLNEIGAELRKAARGAGLPWGLADEVGRAGRTLAASIPEALPALAGALEAVESGACAWRMRWNKTVLEAVDERPVSPLALGPAISDFLPFAAPLQVTASVVAPALLAPFLAATALRLGRVLTVLAGGHVVRVGGDCLSLFDALGGLDASNGLRVEVSTEACAPVAARAAGPVALPDTLWRRFNRLAALTYVPASSQSRLAGAGAGLSDND